MVIVGDTTDPNSTLWIHDYLGRILLTYNDPALELIPVNTKLGPIT